MIIRIEFARERSDLVAPLWETARNLGDDDLSDTVARWLRRLDERYNLALPGMEELLAMQDVSVLTSRLDETIEEWQREAVARGRLEGRNEGLVEGRNEGLVEGRTEGLAEAIVRERALLRRMVVRRFGPESGEVVGLLIEEVTDWEQLVLIGEWILDAQEAAELRDRLVSLPRGA